LSEGEVKNFGKPKDLLADKTSILYELTEKLSKNERNMIQEIANGNIDLAVVGGEVPQELQKDLRITSYAEDELALILPLSHPFSTPRVLLQVKREAARLECAR